MDDTVVHIDWSYSEQGAQACREGKPCEPPEDLHMLAQMSWAAGWLEETDREYPEDYDYGNE